MVTYLAIVIGVLLLAGIAWLVRRNKLLSRELGDYELWTSEQGFHLKTTVEPEHRVRLAAHVIASRLFYYRGTAEFDELIDKARQSLENPTVPVLSSPPTSGSKDSGRLTYAGVGLSGSIGGNDNRVVRYPREVQGIIRAVLEDDRTSDEARAVLPTIVEQEADSQMIDLGQVNARVRKHFGT